MNKYDPETATNTAAQMLIESQNGLSVALAEKAFTVLELGLISNQQHHPEDVAYLFEIVKELPVGSALQAARLARDVIRLRTPVNANSEFMISVFEYWKHEAALSSGRAA